VTYRLDGPALSIPDAMTSALSEQWARFARPGTWWTGAERTSIATEARAARHCALCRERKAALSPYSLASGHAANGVLSADVVDAVHRIVTDPGRLSSKWYRELIETRVVPEQVVEIAGLVGILTIGDTLARACGCAPSPILDPE
jgi:hypothetical protein